ncbi:hypothetical protein EZV62_009830 [Acer yangbiense]|uniref:Uncharacterized protein n=1 Tax=Acer yangbiense TaxID=1000413 RepID=A0A5C7I2B8_9ROSI|nr:hypothetical protein EZV62_009830 [Acer yangbiense]
MLKDPRRLYAPRRLYHIVERKLIRYSKCTLITIFIRNMYTTRRVNFRLWCETETLFLLNLVDDLMLEKDRIMEIPANQRMERQESLAREHSVEYKAALERAVALDIPPSYSPLNYGTFHDSTRPG